MIYDSGSSGNGALTGSNEGRWNLRSLEGLKSSNYLKYEGTGSKKIENGRRRSRAGKTNQERRSRYLVRFIHQNEDGEKGYCCVIVLLCCYVVLIHKNPLHQSMPLPNRLTRPASAVSNPSFTWGGSWIRLAIYRITRYAHSLSERWTSGAVCGYTILTLTAAETSAHLLSNFSLPLLPLSLLPLSLLPLSLFPLPLQSSIPLISVFLWNYHCTPDPPTC